VFSGQSLEERIFTGGYPRIYDKNIAPADFYSAYIQTYIERDIRLIKNIHDLSLFARFLKLCAARVGQLLNLTSLANDCGISHFTAQSWLSLLQTSYIVYLLQPHHVNFTKRLTKMPKLYFYDTGLACHLLNIDSSDQLTTHYLRGNLYENHIIAELLKHFTNQGKEAPMYFWRDKTGNEIDCLVELSDGFGLIELKSAQTFHSDFLKNLSYYEKLNNSKYKLNKMVIYAGNNEQHRENFQLLSWRNIDFEKMLSNER
jgi:predicted AAA+ superfamily ATPase